MVGEAYVDAYAARVDPHQARENEGRKKEGKKERRKETKSRHAWAEWLWLLASDETRMTVVSAG